MDWQSYVAISVVIASAVWLVCRVFKWCILEDRSSACHGCGSACGAASEATGRQLPLVELPPPGRGKAGDEG
ncbi:MAG: hypothetical protein KatS3mg111_1776 [Pirellulaceae bacterium]|nr:MAG: hypothetical protein KatS3mg111_1776 [Pirellulaceae bacterium]